MINTLVIPIYRSLGRKSKPVLQSSSNSLTLANFDSYNWSAFIGIQRGLINSFLGPSLIRDPNQLAWEGIEALHFISLLVNEIFLSISHSSTNIKLVKLSRPAWTDEQLYIKNDKKRNFFTTSETLVNLFYKA